MAAVFTVTVRTVSYTHLDVYKRQTWKGICESGARDSSFAIAAKEGTALVIGGGTGLDVDCGMEWLQALPSSRTAQSAGRTGCVYRPILNLLNPCVTAATQEADVARPACEAYRGLALTMCHALSVHSRSFDHR